VEVFAAENVEPVAQAARELGFDVLSASPRARVLAVQSQATPAKFERQVKALAAVHGVRFVREKVLPRTSNDVAARIMGTRHAVSLPTGLRLDGQGEVIAVCDTGLDSGDPDALHPDFAGRVAAIRSYPVAPFWAEYASNAGADDGAADLDSGHGTHVAGSVLGNGTASAGDAVSIRGLAPGARLVFQAIEQEMKWKPSAPPALRTQRYLLAGLDIDLTPLFQWARDRGARIHSNSWGGGDAGAYDDQCRQFDDFAWRHKDFCFVVAAGNDGTDRDRDGAINPTSVASPGTAKNVITVGASENERPAFNADTYGAWWPDDFAVAPFKADPMADDAAQVVAFSSRGPTLDGRVKPDVVAPGTFVLSTRSTRIAPNNFAWGAYPANRSYFHMGGTSMATPLVAGAVALLREYLRKRKRIANPSAALLKALLIAGAERLPGTHGPQALVDNDQGFGRVNVDRSLQQVVGVYEGRGLHTGELSSRRITLPATRRTLRVVLAYTDHPGETLVNNLNLLVRDPAGGRHVGNQPAGGGPVLAMDGRNNVEVVEATGRKGTWTVAVAASNVSRGPQDFALAIVLV
jgi:subtilisin family serine protease